MSEQDGMHHHGGHDHHGHGHHGHGDHQHTPGAGPPRTAADWDARYADKQVWSGRPNPTLVAEATDLARGTALDVGCGEGADAIWLAQQGWQVTATDISRVAIERARAAGAAAGVTVDWLVADIAGGAPGAFDLVTVHYPALDHEDDDAATRALLACVAPGGRLLFVGHSNPDGTPVALGGQPTSERVQPADVVALLGEGWTIEKQDLRPHADGEHARHPFDTVLVVTRDA